MFGIRPQTLARYAREGRLTPYLTPGGHRRYRLSELRSILASAEPSDEEQQQAMDAVRLYEQGWSIMQVAAKFGLSYPVMRRILMGRTTLRDRGGSRK
jgi:hypothetical protein